MRTPTLCVVCGAKVVNLNPKTTVCDSICRRARDHGFTREYQIKRDMRDSERNYELDHIMDDYCKMQVEIRNEEINYNRPL